MSFVSIPVKLAALASVTQSAFATLWGTLAAAVNGNLDARNFSRRARIPNSRKAEPFSIHPVRLTVHEGGGSCSFYVPSGVIAGTVVRWTAFFTGTWDNGATDPLTKNGGSFSAGTLTLSRNGVLLDTALLAGIGRGVICDRALASPVAAGDVFTLALAGLAYNAPALSSDRIWADVWLKTKHVR